MRRIFTLIMVTGLLTLGALVSTAGAQTYAPDVAGTVVTRGSGIEVAGARADRLASTGSDGTTTYLLVGGALLAFGAIFVLSSRRREELLQGT